MYQRRNLQAVNAEAVVAFPAGTVVSASGNSGVLDVGDRPTLRLGLSVTAKSGTSPTLDVAVMTCSTPDGTFRQVYALAVGGAVTFTQASDVTSQDLCFAGLDRFVRIDWTLGGSNTPTMTAGLVGELV